MPRATSKKQLIEDAETTYQALLRLIDSVPLSRQDDVFLFEDRDRNTRDVLIHLYEWHQMMIRWYNEGKKSDTVVTPAVGYNWRQLPALNLVLWQKHQETSLSEAKKMFEQSHHDVLNLIHQESNESLFETRGFYPWTKNNSLGTYFVSSTASHYQWALKKIKKFKKQL